METRVLTALSPVRPACSSVTTAWAKMRDTEPLKPAAVAKVSSLHDMSPRNTLNMGLKRAVKMKRAMNMKM